MPIDKDFKKLVENLFDYMREIYPDCAMIEHLGLGLNDYLVQIAIQQSSKLITAQSVSKDLKQMGAIRIAFIIKHMLKNKKLEEYKEAFCTLYSNIICTINVTSCKQNEISDYYKQAEDWFMLFQRCYNEHLEEYTVYDWELKNQIENYKKEMQPVSNIYNIYNRYLKLLHRKTVKRETERKSLFGLNLELVLAMQNQISIASMNQQINVVKKHERKFFEIEKAQKKEVNIHCMEQTAYILQGGFSDIVDALYRIVNILGEHHEKIFGYSLGKEDLWYRGIANESYHVVPSIYRKYADKTYHVKYDEAKEQTNISLQQLHQYLLQRFRYQADGAPEILNQAIYQDNDYLALMQHYQLPSNLLDWSEDVFAALYFALEDYFLKEEKDIKKGAPAVYVLDPAAYNKARKEMISEVCDTCGEKEKCVAYQNQERLLNKIPELVPNVSTHANKNLLNDYFGAEYLCDANNNYVYPEGKKAADIVLVKNNDTGICECCKLPVAYYSSRLSPRIRAQSGQFLAFSVNIHPYLEKKEQEGDTIKSYEERLSFNYMALDEIQKYYLEGEEGRHPFMLKLIIPMEECSTLDQLLRKFGIKTIKYYPELTHLKD